MRLLIKHWKTLDYLIKAVPQNYGNRCLPAVSYLPSTLLYIQKNGSWRWFQNRLQLAFVLLSWLRSINMLFSFITPFKISLEFKNVLVFSILSNTIEYMPHSQLRCRAFLAFSFCPQLVIFNYNSYLKCHKDRRSQYLTPSYSF